MYKKQLTPSYPHMSPAYCADVHCLLFSCCSPLAAQLVFNKILVKTRNFFKCLLEAIDEPLQRIKKCALDTEKIIYTRNALHTLQMFVAH